MGRRDAGTGLRSACEESRGHQRPRHRPDRRHAGVLPPAGHGIPAGVRTARGGDARHPGRPDADARRVRHAVARRGARARDRARRWLPDRRRDRGQHRALEGQAQGMAVFAAGDAAAPRRGARGAARRRDVPPAGPRRHAAQAGRGGSRGAHGRQVAQGRDPGRARSLLSRRHRPRAGARHAGTGRAHHARRSRPVAAAGRGAAADPLPRHRRLQARHLDAGARVAAVAEPPRELRPQGARLQQRELHPHRVPGDEPRLRRPRLLLRRPVLPAGRADPRPAVEGVREGARRDDPHGAQRRDGRPGRSVSVPGRHEPVRRPAAEADARGARRAHRASCRPPTWTPSRMASRAARPR